MDEKPLVDVMLKGGGRRRGRLVRKNASGVVIAYVSDGHRDKFLPHEVAYIRPVEDNNKDAS